MCQIQLFESLSKERKDKKSWAKKMLHRSLHSTRLERLQKENYTLLENNDKADNKYRI